MKIYACIISVLIMSNVMTPLCFAEMYTVSIDANQQEALVYVSEQMKKLPDEFVQSLVSDYLDGLAHKAIEDAFMMLSVEERFQIAQKHFPENIFKDPYAVPQDAE